MAGDATLLCDLGAVPAIGALDFGERADGPGNLRHGLRRGVRHWRGSRRRAWQNPEGAADTHPRLKRLVERLRWHDLKRSQFAACRSLSANQ
jgi:hypothetical protein